VQAEGPNDSILDVQQSTVIKELVLKYRTDFYLFSHLGTCILKDNFFGTENVINMLNDSLFSDKKATLIGLVHHDFQ
jgi:hypothetical protein